MTTGPRSIMGRVGAAARHTARGTIRRGRALRSRLELATRDGARTAALTSYAARHEAAGLMGPLSQDVEEWAPFLRWAGPGHFYSPIPTLTELRRDADRIWGRRDGLPGIDLRRAEQTALLRELSELLAGEQLAETPQPDRAYYAQNVAFGVGDATILHGMLRRHRPTRIVEIGSGYSSALMLDVVRAHLPDTSLTFVEPYPELLEQLIGGHHHPHLRVLPVRAQDMPIDLIRTLEPDDVLFIDSTHVVRTGSDVCHLVHEVLPEVRPGVVVHLHDMFWPFEAPRPWVEEGRLWSECHLVRAMLVDNPHWQIELFNDYLAHVERATIEQLLPQVLGNTGGSLWLRRR